MADRGFQIKEELLFHLCSFEVSSGARMKSQMTSAEVKKTKDVANLWIDVESAINRIKSFRILKNTPPISLLQNINDILWTILYIKTKTYLLKQRRQIKCVINK